MTGPMNDMAGLEAEFLGHAVAQQHPLVREWRGEKLEADLREATAAILDIVADDAGAQRVADIMHVLGRPAASYKGRLMAAGGVRCIAHIDFPNPSGDLPFVKIRAASVPPGSIAEWGPFAAAVAGPFEEFRPRALNFFQPSHLPLRAPAARIYRHLLAAPARTMAERPDAAGLARVELRRGTGLDFYPQYEAGYAQMFEERPHLKDEVRVETRETLAECLEEGLLAEVFVDGAWSGLIAAQPDMVAGVRGLHMVEILLARPARGQGLGPAVHQRFARSVAATDPAAVLMGTISEKNTPSLRTALRAGRIEVGAFYWVDL